MHERYMRHAIRLARRNPAAPFAAILVDRETGKIVAEGVNRSFEDPTCHGEIDVIRSFASQNPDTNWGNLVLYTTAEPCCMCQGAILWSGIQNVVYGTKIPTLVRLGWAQIGIRAAEVDERTDFGNCSIIGGILEDECNSLFENEDSLSGSVRA